MTDPAARAPQPPVVLPAALYWELVATRRQVKLAAVDVRQAQQRAQQCDAALRAVVDRVTRKGVDPHQPTTRVTAFEALSNLSPAKGPVRMIPCVWLVSWRIKR